MNSWPKHPIIYEINTWVWLAELSRKYKRPVILASVPSQEWDLLSGFSFDAIWFMGVWERSPAGTAIANQNKEINQGFRKTLPDFQPEDNVGSPYCVRQYQVDPHLGGRKGLAAARKELAGRDLKLILDFVPNHVAPDHPWVFDHPEYFVSGSEEDVRNDPSSFFTAGGTIIARGRDPYYPAWPDVLQLNAFEPGLRQAVVEVLSDIAGQCDGVRCDMAMLLLNRIFERTWGGRAGQRPATEYWVDVISTVKKLHPDFLFMAEAYWDLEWELQQQGFDYCYDKRLYDRLEHDTAENVRLHLCADSAYQEKLVRFIENHDEPRARSVFSREKECAAAVTMATIPGAKLFHEGQFEGRKVRLSVFLGRRPVEPVEPELQAFYHTLLKSDLLREIRDGQWQLCEQTGWPDNISCRNLVAWCWRGRENRCLIVVNLSDSRSQGMIRLSWDDLSGTTWQISDFFTEQIYNRDGNEINDFGLYIDLLPWSYHILTRWQKEQKNV